MSDLDDAEIKALICAAHHYDIPPTPENEDFLQSTLVYQSSLLDERLRECGRVLRRPFEQILEWINGMTSPKEPRDP